MALAQTTHSTVPLQKFTVPLAFEEATSEGDLDWLLAIQTAVQRILPEWACYGLQKQSAGLELFTGLTLPLYESGTVPLVIGAKPIPEEETWMDEPLPRLPLETRHVRIRFRVAGQGTPRPGFEVESSLYDDES